MNTVVERVYTDEDIKNKTTLTIDKLIDGDPDSDEVTEAKLQITASPAKVNIVTPSTRKTALKVVIDGGLNLEGYLDIAMNGEDNKLEYKGVCKITSKDMAKAPIHVGSGTRLTIYCEDTHTEKNKNELICDFEVYKDAAGIGGNFGEDAGRIIIQGKGSVVANSENGAGIGGGYRKREINATVDGGDGGIITIGDSVKVKAISIRGAGIGGGHGYYINPATIIVTGGNGGIITIEEMANVEAASVYGAGIGGGYGHGINDGGLTGIGIGGNGGIITITGVGIVKAESQTADDIGGGAGNTNGGKEGDILIANPNIIVSNMSSDTRNPKLLSKRLLYYNEANYSNRTVGLIEVNNSDQEINKYMTGTDRYGEFKFYFHNETLLADRRFIFGNRYPNYSCTTNTINNIDFQQLKFPCELSRGINLYI